MWPELLPDLYAVLAITAVACVVLGVVVVALERWERRRAARKRMRPTQTMYRGKPWN
jgi:hypothetical protein